MRIRRHARVNPARAVLWNLLLVVWAAVGATSALHLQTLEHAGGLAPAEKARVIPAPRLEQAEGTGPLDDVAALPGDARGSGQGKGVWFPSRLPPIDNGTNLQSFTGRRASSRAGQPAEPVTVTANNHGRPIAESNHAEPHESHCCGSSPKGQPERTNVLRWLKDHQNRKGYWSPAAFGDDSSRRDAYHSGIIEPTVAWGVEERGDPACRVGNTALALDCFIDAGYDHKEGEYRACCRQALLWLRKQIGKDGAVAGARDLRAQACVVMTLAEAYGLSGDQVLKPMATKTLEWLLAQRTTGSGWGTRAGAEPDIISTTLAVIALKSARMAGIDISTDEVYHDVAGFLEQLGPYDGNSYTCYSNTYWQSQETPIYTRAPINEACWITCMLFMGKRDLDDEDVIARRKYLARDENRPVWEVGRVDFLYWWIGTLATYQVGGNCWKGWEKALQDALVKHQRGWHAIDVANGWTGNKALDEQASWDPVDPWIDGGRVRSTVLAALSMNIYERYIRLSDGD